MWNWEKFVSFIRTLKGRRREQAAFAIAALCFPAGYAVGGLLPETKDGIGWKEWLQIGLYVVGATCLAYALFRVWRLNHPPELPPGKDRPSAIKGPMAFTEADGELFRKLGRESELQKLLGLTLNDQVLMVVIRGASGAGKTSLLRAGLKHILESSQKDKDKEENGRKDKGVQFHYWEAVPTEPDKGLLRAIQEKWPEGATKPNSLDELVNPADALGRQSHVIVLDQFEQLRGNKKIFQLLSQIIRKSKPPHRITWVIAFREEFFSDWMKSITSEYERGFHPPLMFLDWFTTEQAKDVIGQLMKEADLSFEDSVLNNLVEAATVEGKVSPVDISIGLLVLEEIYRKQSGRPITIRDYQFAGGAEGLLTQYIDRRLDEYFSKTDREKILKAMLALRDPETNQRLAEGLTIDELATESSAEARLLKTQLDRLSHRDTRLLETVTSADGSAVRYRLPHERLVPALYRLTGKLLAEVDQAKLKFQNAYQAWKTNDKRSSYLLKAKELKLVERYETQIPWGNDEQEKEKFLRISQRRRTSFQVGSVSLVLALFVSGWVANMWYQRYEGKRYLHESGYPEELYDWQHQLKRLELTHSLDLERFTWLSSRSIEELSLWAESSSNSLAGLRTLSRCQSLRKLTLNLSTSQVSDLTPLEELKKLTQLTLSLSFSQVNDLKPLEQLNGLTHLTLDLTKSRVSNLEPLSKLTNLKQLTIKLSNEFVETNQASSLEPLSKLANLNELSLDLSEGSVANLEFLFKFKNQPRLMLDLGPNIISKLEYLPKLSNLTDLTLDLRYTGQNNIEILSQLSSLTQLRLKFYEDRISNLEPLSRLSSLSHLILDLSEPNPTPTLGGLIYPLTKLSEKNNLESLATLNNLSELTINFDENIFASRLNFRSSIGSLNLLSNLTSLDQLTLDLSYSSASDLNPLVKLSELTKLTLDLGFSQVSDLKLLKSLSKLTELNLDFRYGRVNTLEALSELRNLTQLTLNLSESQVSDLKPLEQLNALARLALNLGNSQVSDLKPLQQLNKLTQLTLDTDNNFRGKSKMNDLKPLQQLQGLTQLTLSLNDEASGLEMLSKLTNMQSLSIRGTKTQRMSLQKIPASVRELKF